MAERVSMVGMASMAFVDPVALSCPWELLVETHAMVSTVETALMVAEALEASKVPQALTVEMAAMAWMATM